MVLQATRATASWVRFAHPFSLGHDPRELPAGRYAVHTVEDVYRGVVNDVFVVRSVDLIVDTVEGSTTRIVRPVDLREAQQRDAAESLRCEAFSENPDRGCATALLSLEL